MGVCRGGGIQDGGGDMFCLLLINGCIMLVDKGFFKGDEVWVGMGENQSEHLYPSLPAPGCPKL